MPPSENPQTQAGDRAGQRGGAILTHHPPCRSPAHTPWGAQPLFHSTEGLGGGSKAQPGEGQGMLSPTASPICGRGWRRGVQGTPSTVRVVSGSRTALGLFMFSSLFVPGKR